MTPQAAVAKFEPATAVDARDERVARLSREFGQRIVALVQSAAITVVDATSCADAVALRSTIGEIRKEIEAGFKTEKDYYHRKHAEVCAEEHKLLDQLIDPRNSQNPNTIDGKLSLTIQTWTTAEDRRRREEEQRLADARRKEEEARAAAEAAAHESAGDHVLAEAVLAEAIAAPTPLVTLPNIRSQVPGLKTRRDIRWRFAGGQNKVKDILRETSPEVLARVMKLLPREYCEPSVKKIDGVVDAMQLGTKIPGIEVYDVDVPIR